MDNDERALRAEAALAVGTDNDTPEDDVSDLLADLMHLCDQHVIDFSDRLRIATMNYEEEKFEDDDKPL